MLEALALLSLFYLGLGKLRLLLFEVLLGFLGLLSILVFIIGAKTQNAVKHARNLFGQEGHRPRDQVHVVWKAVGRLRFLVLFQLQVVVLEDQHGSLVVVGTAVVRRREDRYHVGEGVLAPPLVHFESFALHLVAAEDRKQLIAFQELLNGFLTEVVAAFTLGIILELVVRSVFVVHGISPKQVTKDTVERDLLKPVQLVDLFDSVQFLRNATVHSKIFLGYKCSDGQRVEYIHKHVVDFNIVAFQNFFAESK